jgi:hypothetical protein
VGASLGRRNGELTPPGPQTLTCDTVQHFAAEATTAVENGNAMKA